jgi:hypothetical protein
VIPFLNRCFDRNFLVFLVLFSFLSPLSATEVLPPVQSVENSKNPPVINREEGEISPPASPPSTPHQDLEPSKTVDEQAKREVRKALFPTTPVVETLETPVVKKVETKEPYIKVKVVSCGHGNFNIINFHLPNGTVKQMIYDAGTMNIDKPFKFTSHDSPPRPLKKRATVKQQQESQQGSESSLSQDDSSEVHESSLSPTVKNEDEDKENRTPSPVLDPKTPERSRKKPAEETAPNSITRPYSIKKILSQELSEDTPSFRSDETYDVDAFLQKQSKEFLAMPQTMVFSHNNKDHLSFGPRLLTQIRDNLDSPDAFVPHIILAGALPWEYNLTVGKTNFYDWLIDQREKGSKIYFPTISYEALSTELLKKYKTKPESVVYAPPKFAKNEDDKSLFPEALDFGDESFRVLPLGVNLTHANISDEGEEPEWMRYINKETNRDSMILKVVCKRKESSGSSMIFTGDADDKTFEIVRKKYTKNPGMLEADIVQVPHHGSAHENKDETKKFYQATGKGIRIASCAVDLDEETYENAKPSAIQVDPVHKVTLRSFAKLEDLEGAEEQVTPDSKKKDTKKKDTKKKDTKKKDTKKKNKKSKEDAEKEKKELKQQEKDKVFTKTTHTGIFTTLNEGDIHVELRPSKEAVKVLIKDGTTPVTPYKGEVPVDQLKDVDEEVVDEEAVALLGEGLDAINPELRRLVDGNGTTADLFEDDDEEDDEVLALLKQPTKVDIRTKPLQRHAVALKLSFDDENVKNGTVEGTPVKSGLKNVSVNSGGLLGLETTERFE